MTGSKKSGSKHEYHITGSAAIYSGDFPGTIVTTNIGAQSADPLEQLGEELAKIRQRLEGDSYPNVAPDVRDKALQAATKLKDDLPSLRKTDPDTRRTLRARVRGLIDRLAPVAEIIGGIAGLEAILQHL